jgi:hypothetical protein
MNLYLINKNGKSNFITSIKSLNLSREEERNLNRYGLIHSFTSNGEMTLMKVNNNQDNKRIIAKEVYKNPILLDETHIVKIKHYKSNINGKIKLHSFENIPSYVDTTNKIINYHNNGIIMPKNFNRITLADGTKKRFKVDKQTRKRFCHMIKSVIANNVEETSIFNFNEDNKLYKNMIIRKKPNCISILKYDENEQLHSKYITKESKLIKPAVSIILRRELPQMSETNEQESKQYLQVPMKKSFYIHGNKISENKGVITIDSIVYKYLDTKNLKYKYLSSIRNLKDKSYYSYDMEGNLHSYLDKKKNQMNSAKIENNIFYWYLNGNIHSYKNKKKELLPAIIDKTNKVYKYYNNGEFLYEKKF